MINALTVIQSGLITNDLPYTPTLGDQGTHYSCIRPDDLTTTNALPYTYVLGDQGTNYETK